MDVRTTKWIVPLGADPPCDGCCHWDLCRGGLACDRFSNWANTGRIDLNRSDKPDAWYFFRLFGGSPVRPASPLKSPHVPIRHGKAVVNLETGQVFDSLGAAAMAAGVTRNGMRRKLAGKPSRTVRGRWAYVADAALAAE